MNARIRDIVIVAEEKRIVEIRLMRNSPPGELFNYFVNKPTVIAEKHLNSYQIAILLL